MLILKFYRAVDREPLEFVLVQWYEEESKLWKCPKLKLIKYYSCIPIESIDKTVHIVQRFDKTNEYLMNIYMF